MTGSGVPPMALGVECYSGYRGEETPRRFTLGGKRIEIVEILDRWLGEDHRYFKVAGEDGGVYILRHGREPQGWELTAFEAGPKGT